MTRSRCNRAGLAGLAAGDGATLPWPGESWSAATDLTALGRYKTAYGESCDLAFDASIR